MRQHDLILALALTLCSGCTTEEAPNTAGVDIEPTQCGRGFIVISSDYQSTNVSLLDTSGKTVSESIISSGSADPGLTAALSGDVVAPTMTQQQDAFVLVDRFPAATLTWVDLKTTQVRTQLNVGTGFAANPQDYLHIGDSKGYVSRYERNPLAGQQPYDEGDDVLVIDPSTASIKARIGLEALREDGVLARPGRMVQSGKMA